VSYSRPYGLDGLDWGQLAGGVRHGTWAWGVGITSLGLDRYRESDVQVAAGLELPGDVRGGIAIHWMMVDRGPLGIDGVPSFDLGVAWQRGILSVGAAGRRINLPRFDSGDELPLVLLAGAALQPVDELEVAADLRREGSEYKLGLGTEFRIVPVLAIRVGGAYEPLQYAAGVGIAVGPLRLDYSYRFHPQLKDTHSIGVRTAWH
jgi:hypothetical protein